VVLAIILLISIVALPTILPAVSHRQVSEGARLLQAQLAGARDAAIRDNATCGIRLLADPTTPNACNGFVPLVQPPNYSTGLVSVFPAAQYSPSVFLGTTALVLEESATDAAGLPNEPTSWFWNVRVGDKIQINHTGPWLTVCGPLVIPIAGMTVLVNGTPTLYADPEGFVNYGPSGGWPSGATALDGSALPTNPIGHDYLLLTNGRDDNANGWIDEGWDGVDNNGNGQIDEPAEWEQEAWVGAAANGVNSASYMIRRRPFPASAGRTVYLPSNIVIDMTRSNLPTILDLTVSPQSEWAPSLPWGVPASISMGGSWFQFWLAERADVGSTMPAGTWYLVNINGRSGKVNSSESPDLMTGLAVARQE
jgi:hypothetical protein